MSHDLCINLVCLSMALWFGFIWLLGCIEEYRENKKNEATKKTYKRPKSKSL